MAIAQTKPLGQFLNPLGQLMKPVSPLEASQSFKGMSKAKSQKVASEPYNYLTAPSPFTKENAPTITGALTGAGTTREMKSPLPIAQAPSTPQVSSMAGRKNIPTQPSTPIIPVAKAGESRPMNLFSDEQAAFKNMIDDGLDEKKAYELIKERRNDLMGGNTKLSDFESAALLKMQQDGVSANEAISMLTQYRTEIKAPEAPKEDNRPLWKKAGEGAVNLMAGNLETVLKYGGNLLDLGTGGQAGFGEDVKAMTEQNKQLFGDSTAFKAGSYLPDVAMSVAPLGKAVQSMSAVKGGALVGAGFGAAQPVLEKGSEATMREVAAGGAIGGTVGAVAGPVISKGIEKGAKYGTALIKGGLEGAGRSISRDVKGIGTGIQKSIEKVADTSATNINRMSAGQIRKFNKEIGVSPGKFLLDRGITDTGDDLVVKLSDNLKKSRKSADEGLAAIKGRFKAPMKEIATSKIDEATGKFKTIKSDPIDTMLADNLENASSKGMSKESLRAKQLLEKYREGGLTMTEINEAKRFLNANNKFSYFSDDVTPRKGFITNLDTEVRNWQFDTAKKQGFSNLGQINKDTKAYYKLLEGIGGWQEKTAGNNPMGLTDWLAFNADPGIFLAKQAAQSNIVKRGFLKATNALSGRKVQAPIKVPSNITKNGVHNRSNSPIMDGSKLKDVKPLINLAEEKVKAGIKKAPALKVEKESIKKPFAGSPSELAKNKKGFINPKAIGEDLGVVKKNNIELEGAMSHRPTKNGVGYNIDSEKSAPDFYTHPEYYDFGGKEYKESIQAIKAMHNKPDAEVTIYRASPYNELRKGDWITLSKEKAKMEQGLEKGSKINSFKVKAKDLHFAGDDITEFGYWGEGIKPLLKLGQKIIK